MGIENASNEFPKTFSVNSANADYSSHFFFMQVNLDGLTGPVQFNEYGNRKGINLEILNLQNNSFIKVSRWVVSAISYSLFGYRIVNQGLFVNHGLCATHKRNPFNDG